MIVTIEPGKRPDGNVGVDRGRPEKGFRMVGTGGDASASDETVGQPGALTDPGTVPDDGTRERGAGADRGAAEDAVGGFEPGGLREGEDPRGAVERSAAGGKGSAARERFERRAEEIARAAEVGVRAMMANEAKLFPPLVEQGLPEVADEGRLAGGDALSSRGESTQTPV